MSRSTYAVLTGDVVAYRSLPEDQRPGLIEVLRAAYQRVCRLHPGGVSTELAVFRGDSWQFVMSAPDKSLRAALLVRAHMLSRSLDTRVAIGIGTVDFLPSAALPTGDGEAFRMSGGALDGMPRGRRLAIRASGPLGSMDQPTSDILVLLLDALVGGWTPARAAAVAGALEGLSQRTIGTRWEGGAISQQAVAQHLDRAHWYAVAQALQHFETELRRGFGT